MPVVDDPDAVVFGVVTGWPEVRTITRGARVTFHRPVRRKPGSCAAAGTITRRRRLRFDGIPETRSRDLTRAARSHRRMHMLKPSLTSRPRSGLATVMRL
jgi:hypothetical protein